MAERRMFTKKVTDDDNFMSLSASAQALYLHLSMSADDDGFCNQVSISMFKAHASVQDLQALLEKRYIYQFENGVIVIKHWRMANALRKDRYTPTAFKEELAKLKIKKNGAYTMSEIEETTELIEEESGNTKRQEAYKNSSLPYSFDYKIKHIFYGRKCPICGCEMKTNVDETGVVSDNRLPTIQHNVPISKGGEHELGNISVICKQCNITIQDKETGDLNAEEVIKEWEKIDGCRLVATCLPQDRIGKDSIDKGSIDNIPPYIPPKGKEPKKQTASELRKVFNSLVEESDLSDALKVKMYEWLDYKSQIKNQYKSPDGFSKLLTQVSKKALEFTDTEVIRVMDDTMAAGYKGIVWDWLNKQKQNTNTGSAYIDAIHNRLDVVDKWLKEGD